MKARQDILEIFSSFLNLDADSVRGWITDPKLRRSMQRCLEQAQPEQNEQQHEQQHEQQWAIYWHRTWQESADPTPRQTLAASHLIAYVQEPYYWTAKKIWLNFPNQQSIADLFQTAIVAFPKALKNFNSQFSQNFKGYAELIASNAIKESLRKNQAINICSDWALLNKLTQKRLVEALKHGGLNDRQIADYSLAWRCYQELYQAGNDSNSRQLKAPTDEIWQAIAVLYHQQAISQTPAARPADANKLSQWLSAIAQAVRRYQAPNVISANAPIVGQEEGELLDTLAAGEDSLMGELLVQEESLERRQQNAAMDAALKVAIAELDPTLQTLLKVYYGENLTQQEIATKLDMKQYTISRRLASIRSTLLRHLATWAQTTLHVELTPSVLDNMNNLLEDWLMRSMQPPAVNSSD